MVLDKAALILFWGPLPALQVPPYQWVPPQIAVFHGSTLACSLPSPAAASIDTYMGLGPVPPPLPFYSFWLTAAGAEINYINLYNKEDESGWSRCYRVCRWIGSGSVKKKGEGFWGELQHKR